MRSLSVLQHQNQSSKCWLNSPATLANLSPFPLPSTHTPSPWQVKVNNFARFHFPVPDEKAQKTLQTHLGAGKNNRKCYSREWGEKGAGCRSACNKARATCRQQQQQQLQQQQRGTLG